MKFKDSTCRVDSICGCSVGDEGGDDDTANTIYTSINVGNIETEDTLSNVIRASDNEVSHQNRADNLDFVKIPKVFIELKSRRMNYFVKAL